MAAAMTAVAVVVAGPAPNRACAKVRNVRGPVAKRWYAGVRRSSTPAGSLSDHVRPQGTFSRTSSPGLSDKLS